MTADVIIGVVSVPIVLALLYLVAFHDFST